MHLMDINVIGPLKEKISARSAQVCVIGLGYVGLPMALAFAEAGFHVLGLDNNPDKSATLRSGKSYITDVSDEQVRSCIATGRFQATSDSRILKDADIILICVPTPLSKSKDPDMSAILSATSAVSNHIRPGQLIVLESTTYPGTTEEVLLPELSKSGLTVGINFFLAFSPERIDPGNTNFSIETITKVVGGVTANCTEIATLFYQQTIRTVVSVSSPGVAETSKLLENTFRSVNIGLANEMALICERLGINVWEVIAAAATKPFGFMPHYPGPGIGGHCIPLDPHYLSWKARLSGYEPKFISLASEINSSMPHHVVKIVVKALNDASKSVRGSNILILGMAYKPNISDYRESPSLEILEILLHQGASVQYSDPFVSQIEINNQILTDTPLTPSIITDADCILIITHHKQFDYEAIIRNAKLVVDTRNITRPLASLGNVYYL